MYACCMDGWMYTHVVCMDVCMSGWKLGWVDGWVRWIVHAWVGGGLDEWMHAVLTHEWMDGWMDAMPKVDGSMVGWVDQRIATWLNACMARLMDA